MDTTRYTPTRRMRRSSGWAGAAAVDYIGGTYDICTMGLLTLAPESRTFIHGATICCRRICIDR